MLDSIRLERELAYTPEQVWTALTDRRALAEWLMPNDFEPRVGHRFTFQIDPTPGCNSETACEVLEVDRPRRLVYTWLPVYKAAVQAAKPSVVTWTLASSGTGTLLTLVHSGLEGAFPWWQRMMLRFGWGTMVKSWIGKCAANVHGGVFTPGAFPPNKRCYKAEHIPAHLTK